MSMTAPQTAKDHGARQIRLSELAKAKVEDLAPLFAAFSDAHSVSDYTVLRQPECGTAMVRGRTGASGAPFNLGEMTITRMSLRLDCGAVGHGYVQGRSKDAARMVALLDAMAEAGAADIVDQMVVAPLRAMRLAKQADRANKAAATKVEFFTMVRGEG